MSETYQTIRLWDAQTPLYDAAAGLPEPYMEVFHSERAAADAPFVILCPGGAYEMLANEHEGRDVAAMLCENGIHAGVLYYRYRPYHYPAMLLDGNRAVRLVRHHAAAWGVDPKKIGILGFSAGGNCAVLAAEHYDGGIPDGDAIDRQSSRPDFAVLCYGVLSLADGVTHEVTRDNLLGADGSGGAEYEALRMRLSAEHCVPDDCPPMFLWHSAADTCVTAKNSLLLAAALLDKQIPVELHLFPYGGHGIGMGDKSDRDQRHAGQWVPLLLKWMQTYVMGEDEVC